MKIARIWKLLGCLTLMAFTAGCGNYDGAYAGSYADQSWFDTAESAPQAPSEGHKHKAAATPKPYQRKREAPDSPAASDPSPDPSPAPAPAPVVPANAGILVLEYHDVEPAPALASHPAWQTNDDILPADTFAAQLDALDRAGFHTLSLAEFGAALSTGNVPKKSVLITFDDGYTSFYQVAYPLLKQHHMHAAVFVVTAYTSDGAPTKPGFLTHLTWAELATMEASGLVDVGSHSYNLHGQTNGQPDILTAPAATLRADLRLARQQLETHLHQVVKTVSFPYGANQPALLAAAKEAGYSWGFGPAGYELATPAANPLSLPRWHIGHGVQIAEFSARLKQLSQ